MYTALVSTAYTSQVGYKGHIEIDSHRVQGNMQCKTLHINACGMAMAKPIDTEI